jgi:hypothetical protein
MNTQDNGPLLDRHGEALIQIREIGGTWKIVSMAPVSILAPPDRTVFERVATLASDLSANDGGGAAAIFDSEMKGYGEIAANIDALTAQADILCAIDVIVDHEANGVHKLDVDWYMELKSRAADAPAERRRERVQLQLEKIRGRWKINALAPLNILAPIRIP